MFEEYFKKSNVIELITEEFDGEYDPKEDSVGTVSLTFRLLKGMQKPWLVMLKNLLQEAKDEESFDLEPRKSYYIAEEEDGGGLRFVWVLLIWGDLEMASAAISDILETVYVSPAARAVVRASGAPTMRPTTPGKARTHHLSSRTELTDEGRERVVTKTKLPHAGSTRYKGDPNKRISMEDRHSKKRGQINATTSGCTDKGFAPTKEREL